MDDNKILELTGQIENTLGSESFATIADTIGELLTGNTQNMQAIADRDNTIKQLQDRNEKLVAANGALLQKVPMASSPKKPEPEVQDKQPTKTTSLKDAFDEKGNFRR